MVFVRKSPGRSGSTKVQIAERRDGRDVVLEHVGTARDEAELAVLMAQARRRVHEGQETLDLEVVGLEDEGVPQRPGLITSKRSALLWQVLTEAYARLGFDVIDDEAFAQLVLARIIEPTSKADSMRVLNEIGAPAVSLRTMFRSLQRAQERDYRGQIAASLLQPRAHRWRREPGALRRHHALLRSRERGRAAQGRLLQGAPRRPADRGRAAGRPRWFPPRDRLLRGQQG